MSKYRKYKLITEIISTLLILLFVYAAVSKLSDFDSFQGQMKAQPLPAWMTPLAVWSLPAAELTAGALLVFSRTLIVGLFVSLVLMLIFTAYLALALTGTFGSLPCSCGGVIESLTWEAHLAVNLIFTTLSIMGIILYGSHKKHKEL